MIAIREDIAMAFFKRELSPVKRFKNALRDKQVARQKLADRLSVAETVLGERRIAAERLAVAGEVRALTSQTRASMFVIAAAPVVFCLFASATDPRTSTFLFRSPAGLVCLAAGISLDITGGLWMRRLCRVSA